VKTHRINTVADMLTMSDAEFARMLPDLCEWRRLAMVATDAEPSIEHTGFIWVDDGNVEVTHVEFTDPATGAVDVRWLP